MFKESSSKSLAKASSQPRERRVFTLLDLKDCTFEPRKIRVIRTSPTQVIIMND